MSIEFLTTFVLFKQSFQIVSWWQSMLQIREWYWPLHLGRYLLSLMAFRLQLYNYFASCRDIGQWELYRLHWDYFFTFVFVFLRVEYVKVSDIRVGDCWRVRNCGCNWFSFRKGSWHNCNVSNHNAGLLTWLDVWNAVWRGKMLPLVNYSTEFDSN